MPRGGIFRIQLTQQQQVIRSSIILLLIIILPLVVFFLPIDFFDRGKSICLSKVLLNTQCYACGLTRACKHLMHLDWEGAFKYNMGSFIIFPLLAFLWIRWYFDERKKLKNLIARKNNT